MYIVQYSSSGLFCQACPRDCSLKMQKENKFINFLFWAASKENAKNFRFYVNICSTMQSIDDALKKNCTKVVKLNK